MGLDSRLKNIRQKSALANCSRYDQNYVLILFVCYPARYLWHMMPDLTPSNNQFFLQDVQRSLPFFNYPTLYGWYEGNHRWQPVHFTLGHRLSVAILHPVGVTPNIAKLNLKIPERTNHFFSKWSTNECRHHRRPLPTLIKNSAHTPFIVPPFGC